MSALPSSPTTALVLLSAATGARSMTGVAATVRAASGGRHHRNDPQPLKLLRAPRVKAMTGAFAAMELAVDKVPGIPNRIDSAPLAARVAAGALIGATVNAMARRDRATGAFVGAVSALVAAELTFVMRRELSRVMPAVVAALVEDAIVAGVAAAGVRQLGTLKQAPMSMK